MTTIVSGAGGSMRGSQDETSPLPIEFDIVRRKRLIRREGRSQDETAPFPLEFEVVAHNPQQSQDETSPFVLEFTVVLPSGEQAFVRTARPPRTRGARRSSVRGLPRLKWHGVAASKELRRYAARIAAGESLPPFRGPILANGELPQVRGAAQRELHAPHALPAVAVDDSKGLVKLALALLVMSALVVSAAVLGNDEQLRSWGQSISNWFAGRDDSPQMFDPIEAAPPRALGSSALP